MNKLYIFIIAGILIAGAIVYAGATITKEIIIDKDKQATATALELKYSDITCSGEGDNAHCSVCMKRKGSNQDEGCLTIMKTYCKTYSKCLVAECNKECTEWATYTDNEIRTMMDTHIKTTATNIINSEAAATKSTPTKLEDGGSIIIKDAATK